MRITLKTIFIFFFILSTATYSLADHYIEPTTGIEFIWIPGGCFMMGATEGNSDEKPVHKVCVEGFWMSKYEITNAQYKMFKPDHSSNGFMGDSLDGDSQPAVYVSWKEAVFFADWLSKYNSGTYSLPSENQWEYAARAGSTGDYYWGESKTEVCNYANTYDLSAARKYKFNWNSFNCTDGFAVSAPVGSFKPNKFGLHDMLGNVWEWCSDWYSKNSYSSNPSTEAGFQKVLRGGSWYNAPASLRLSNRGRNVPDYRIGSVGFRLIRTN